MRRQISRAGAGSRQAGFGYAFLLVAIVSVGIAAQVATTSSTGRKIADREAELLFRGEQYRKAIESYYESGTPTKVFPKRLEDLVDDPRFIRKRHIRRLYSDPITGGDWLLIRGTDGGIQGVTSASSEVPRKQSGFVGELSTFEGAGSYSEWVFEYVPDKPASRVK